MSMLQSSRAICLPLVTSTCASLMQNRLLQGMSLVPSVTELMLAELLYLQYDDPKKPIYMYINSAGVTVSFCSSSSAKPVCSTGQHRRIATKEVSGI